MRRSRDGTAGFWRLALGIGVWVLCGVVLGVPEARSDARLDTLYAQEAVELKHDVRFHREGRAAMFTVRRTFRAVGDAPGVLRVMLDLPPGGVISGLRLRTARGWERAEAFEHDAALARFGGKAARTSGKSSGVRAWVFHGVNDKHRWPWLSRSGLDIAPLRRGQTVTVEYTVHATMSYGGGVYATAYPRPRSCKSTPVALRHTPQTRGDTARCDGDACAFATCDRAAGAVWSQSPAELMPIEVRSVWHEPARLRLAAVDVGDGAVWAYMEVDIAARLEPDPDVRWVVFVVDRSHSSPNVALEPLVQAYTDGMRDVRVQVVAFHKDATVALDDFVAPEGFAQASREPRARAVLLTQGPRSAIDRGIWAAQRLLDGRPGKRRIVAVTDGQVQPSWNAMGTFAPLQNTDRAPRLDILLTRSVWEDPPHVRAITRRVAARGGRYPELRGPASPRVHVKAHPLAWLAETYGGVVLTYEAKNIARVARPSCVSQPRLGGHPEVGFGDVMYEGESATRAVRLSGPLSDARFTGVLGEGEIAWRFDDQLSAQRGVMLNALKTMHGMPAECARVARSLGAVACGVSLVAGASGVHGVRVDPEHTKRGYIAERRTKVPVIIPGPPAVRMQDLQAGHDMLRDIFERCRQGGGALKHAVRVVVRWSEIEHIHVFGPRGAFSECVERGVLSALTFAPPKEGEVFLRDDPGRIRRSLATGRVSGTFAYPFTTGWRPETRGELIDPRPVQLQRLLHPARVIRRR